MASVAQAGVGGECKGLQKSDKQMTGFLEQIPVDFTHSLHA